MTLTISSLPKHMPEFIEVDVSELELGKSIKVEDLEKCWFSEWKVRKCYILLTFV